MTPSPAAAPPASMLERLFELEGRGATVAREVRGGRGGDGGRRRALYPAPGVRGQLPVGARRAIGVGIGLFIALIGAVNARLVVVPAGTVAELAQRPHSVLPVTVIAGALNLGMGDRFDRAATRRLSAGSFGYWPVGMRHFAWAEGETVLQLHG